MSTGQTEIDVIEAPDGIDRDEFWTTSWKGEDHHGVALSAIHLSTTRVGVGPPLHRHPYPEVIMIRQGEAEFTVGDRTVVAGRGTTVVIPAETPHTFRTRGPGRYESVAHHVSPAFVSEQLGPDTAFP